MFNVTVVKLRDVIKIIIILFIVYALSNFLLKNISLKDYLNQITFLSSSDIVEIAINTESSIFNNVINQNTEEFNEQLDEVEENHEEAAITSILQIGANIFNLKEKDKKQDYGSFEMEEENLADETVSQDIDTIVETEVVTENPIEESYTNEYNGVKIKNGTSYNLTDEILNTDNLNINTDNIIIFHTHTCESYTQSENYQYQSSGNYRTTDLNYSVARVGDELQSYLSNLGFNVNHDKTYHDYPSYTGSYTRSLTTVQNILQNFSSDIIIDLHRDAIGSDETYAPLVKIGDDYCAQLMFVIGTDGSGLSHPNWNSNLQFAIKIQTIANELYPGLFKPIILRNSRYNQHLGLAACIIEVGATGNTMEQTLLSMKYLAKIMEEALK